MPYVRPSLQLHGCSQKDRHYRRAVACEATGGGRPGGYRLDRVGLAARLRERLHPRPPAPSRPRRRPARPAAWYACSVDGDFPRTRRRRLTLGQGQVEHTILVLGLDLRLVGVVGQAEAAREAAVEALDAVLFLVLLFFLELALA